MSALRLFRLVTCLAFLGMGYTFGQADTFTTAMSMLLFALAALGVRIAVELERLDSITDL